MSEHVLVKHSEVEIYCTKCTYQHRFATKVRTHFKFVHMGITQRNLNCKNAQCLRFGTTECTLLEDHILYHWKKCKFTTKRRDALRAHDSRLHDGISFSCEECQLSFASKQRLKDHIQRAHQGIIFSCQECQFSATRKEALKRHNQTAHEIILFTCEFCQNSYTGGKDLKCHIKEVHSGFLSTCSQCEFTEKATQLKYHKVSVQFVLQNKKYHEASQ